MKRENLKKSTPGTAATSSKTGWCNSEVFRKFLVEHFLKYVKPTPEEPVVLIYDGHKSHVNIHISDWAIENNIHLFVLPAHTSHFLQPLDVSCVWLDLWSHCLPATSIDLWENTKMDF